LNRIIERTGSDAHNSVYWRAVKLMYIATRRRYFCRYRIYVQPNWLKCRTSWHMGELGSYTVHGVRRQCAITSELSLSFRCICARANGQALTLSLWLSASGCACRCHQRSYLALFFGSRAEDTVWDAGSRQTRLFLSSTGSQKSVTGLSAVSAGVHMGRLALIFIRLLITWTLKLQA